MTRARPGDRILDRFMPEADEGQREAARENLRRLAAALLREAMRQAREEMEADSPVSEDGGTISPQEV